MNNILISTFQSTLNIDSSVESMTVEVRQWFLQTTGMPGHQNQSKRGDLAVAIAFWMLQSQEEDQWMVEESYQKTQKRHDSANLIETRSSFCHSFFFLPSAA